MGTAGTDRAQPRRAAGRADTGTTGRRVGRAQVDGVFFFKTVPYLFHTHAHLGYTGTGTRVFFVVSVFFVVFILQIYFLFCNVVKSE
jgi:hypothetical protein